MACINCRVCGGSFNLINNTHLKTHDLSPSQYKDRFPGAPLSSKETYINNCRARKEYANTEAATAKTAASGRRNKGKKRSVEFCEERSQAYSGKGNPFFGKSHSQETRIKLSAHFQGLSEEEWEGFSNSEYKRAWKSKRAKRWSRETFIRDDYTCALCGQRGGDLEAHHIIRRCDAPELMYENDNGITLCKPCHKGTFGKESELEERFKEMVKVKKDRSKICKVL